MKALKTWEEAQQACRQLYSDLATVASPAESTRLLGAVQEPGELAWIGLYDNMAKWKWTMGHPDFDSNIDYHNWQFDNPKYKGTKDTCGTIRYNGLWRDEICDTERPFVCYHGGLQCSVFNKETLNYPKDSFFHDSLKITIVFQLNDNWRMSM